MRPFQRGVSSTSRRMAFGQTMTTRPTRLDFSADPPKKRMQPPPLALSLPALKDWEGWCRQSFAFLYEVV